jgi:hypothetical protein
MLQMLQMLQHLVQLHAQTEYCHFLSDSIAMYACNSYKLKRITIKKNYQVKQPLCYQLNLLIFIAESRKRDSAKRNS